jgi:Uma2 family endonuclease
MTDRIASAYEPASCMTREEYRAWAEQQPVGRFERINGVVVAMARERVVHSQRKMLVWRALAQAAQEAGLRCEVFTSGVMVEVDDSDFEPDAVVHCGARLSDDAIAVPDLLIIVEVLSPTTSAADRAWKLREYFRLRSVRHYLIVWDDKQQIAHHRRGDAGEIETRTVMDGEIRLDPPGITIAIEDIYARIAVHQST